MSSRATRTDTAGETAGVRARDVQAYLASLAGDWQYPADTVDTFKAGDPDRVVQAIAVAWMSSTWAIQRAAELGCNLFVTHEPTYYDHRDRPPEDQNRIQLQRKRAVVDDCAMTVLRCHDLWDRFPGEGVTDRWGAQLGLEDVIEAGEFTRVYRVATTTALAFARHVASEVSALGQEAVQLIGDVDHVVNRVAIGTGAITPYLELIEAHESDLVICSDDGVTYWQDGAFAIDHGPPIVVVNHAVTEEPAMAPLAARLRAAFPGIAVHHIEQRCTYQLVSARSDESN